jgi:hypothetical protein
MSMRAEPKVWRRLFSDHPASLHESYWQHSRMAWRLRWEMTMSTGTELTIAGAVFGAAVPMGKLSVICRALGGAVTGLHFGLFPLGYRLLD